MMLTVLVSCMVPTGEEYIEEYSSGPPIFEDERLDLEPETLDVYYPGDGSVEPRCTNIDFLFVVDNSGSMSDDQQNLIANFPIFVEGINYWIPSLDSYHLGVVTTDAYKWNQEGCQQLGSLVTRIGNYSDTKVCGVGGFDPYYDGYRYMTNNDDLDDTFSCAANVGSSGSGSELQLLAAIQAAENYINAPGQCNEGFMRDDALFVLVLLTDEDDHSGSSPQEVYDHFLWLKGYEKGEENKSMVVLSIVDTEECGGWQDAALIEEFTGLYGLNGFVGDICAPSYEPFFKDAISVIFGACYGEVPSEP